MTALLFAAAVSVTAQQKVEFSKPADTASDKDKDTTPAQPASSGHSWSIGAFNAPKAAIKNIAPDAPMPQPVYFQNLSPSAQDAWNKRKNWTLLTPEQIMGKQTPEEIMGLANPNGQSKLSLEEQFLLRESQARTASAKDATPAQNRKSDAFALDQDRQNPFARELGTFSKNDQTDEPTGAKAGFLTRLLGPGPSVAEPKPSSAWASVFAQPMQPKPTTAQSDSMDRFRALMVPTSPPDRPAPTVSYSPAPYRDPYLQRQPAFNPVGRSASALQDDLSRPAGIKPLPGATTRPVQSTARPAWQANLPPWLSDKPQPHDTHSF
jgi:hypothetical protein